MKPPKTVIGVSCVSALSLSDIYYIYVSPSPTEPLRCLYTISIRKKNCRLSFLHTSASLGSASPEHVVLKLAVARARACACA